MKRYIACLIIAGAAASAFAADGSSKTQLGVFGSIYDSSYLIGVALPLSDTMKLKPALGLRYSSNPDQYAYEITESGIYARIDLLFDMKIASGLSLGVGPRIGLNATGTSNKYATYTSKYTYTNFLIGGVAELQYLFSRNFGAFIDGALSLGLNTTKYDSGTGVTSEYTVTSFDTSTAIGLIFYF